VVSSFIKGLELNKGFYIDVVKQLLDKKYPDLIYSAALLGYGSDVLGYDTEISMDHNWGPRLQLFIADKDLILELDNYFVSASTGKKLSSSTRNYPPTLFSIRV
jgi:hypothetical protein